VIRALFNHFDCIRVGQSLINDLFPTFEIYAMTKDFVLVRFEFSLLQVSDMIFVGYDPLRTCLAFKLSSGDPIEVVLTLFGELKVEVTASKILVGSYLKVIAVNDPTHLHLLLIGNDRQIEVESLLERSSKQLVYLNKISVVVLLCRHVPQQLKDYAGSEPVSLKEQTYACQFVNVKGQLRVLNFFDCEEHF